MRMTDIPFGVTDWSGIEPTYHEGDAGQAIWRTRYFGPASNQIRVRLVEYTPGYVSNHWCEKGHILFCVEGSLETHLKDGRVMRLEAGHSYQVADGVDAHSSRTATGAKLFIVD